MKHRRFLDLRVLLNSRMALVMLPCDLPWWGQVQSHLTKLQNTRNSLELIEEMQKIHDLCK